jgi:hypothetical protein
MSFEQISPCSQSFKPSVLMSASPSLALFQTVLAFFAHFRFIGLSVSAKVPTLFNLSRPAVVRVLLVD